MDKPIQIKINISEWNKKLPIIIQTKDEAQNIFHDIWENRFIIHVYQETKFFLPFRKYMFPDISLHGSYKLPFEIKSYEITDNILKIIVNKEEEYTPQKITVEWPHLNNLLNV